MEIDMTPHEIARIATEIERLQTNPEFWHMAERVSRVADVPLEALAGFAVNMLTGTFALSAEGAMALASEELQAW